MLLSVQTIFDRVARQHSVHRQMFSVIAQELNVVEFQKPICIVSHDGTVWLIAEIQKRGKTNFDLRFVFFNLINRQQLA